MNDQMKPGKTKEQLCSGAADTGPRRSPCCPLGEHSTTERGLSSQPCGKSRFQNYCRRFTVTVTKGCSALAGRSHPVYKLVCVTGGEHWGKFPFEKCSKALPGNPCSRCALAVCQQSFQVFCPLRPLKVILGVVSIVWALHSYFLFVWLQLYLETNNTYYEISFLKISSCFF